MNRIETLSWLVQNGYDVLFFPRVPCILMLKSCKRWTHTHAARAWHSTKGKMQLMWFAFSVGNDWNIICFKCPKFKLQAPDSVGFKRLFQWVHLYHLSHTEIQFEGTSKNVSAGCVSSSICAQVRRENLEFWKGPHMIRDLNGKNFNGKEWANKQIYNWGWHEANY